METERRDPYMSVTDAAKALGVSVPTVYARIVKGVIKSETIAGRIVIVRASHPLLEAERDQ